MEEFTARIRTYLEERGWDELRPADIAKSIMIEGAELLEVFQWDNQDVAEVRNDPEKIANVRKELADVLIYCFEMAAVLDLDVETLVKEKLANAEEKYPVSVFNRETQKVPGTGAYKEVKERYRREGKN
jgi:NTP pyrophosphatase (non-canonical NTP hydrolase)